MSTSPSPELAVPSARLGAVMLVAAGSTFLAFLDTTVVNVAFPALAEDFPDTPVTDLSWTASAYAVVFAAILAAAGRLADVVGRRRMVLLSVSGFTAASVLTAIAPTIEVLIAGRALQGLFAAGMIPAALAVILAEAPAHRRVQMVGLWGASGSLAAAAGPTVSGLLIEYTSWRAIFLINVPIGLAVVYVALSRLRRDQPTSRQLPDAVGTLALTAGIGGVVLGVTKGEDWGWTDATTVGAIALGAVLVAVGLVRSRRHPAPAVEMDLWRNRTFVIANITSLLAGVGIFAWLLSGPLFLTTVWNYSILTAALAVTPGAVTAMVAAIAIGRRATPEAQGRFITLAMLLFAAVNVWWYLAIDEQAQFWQLWFTGGALGGLAIGAALTGLSTAAALSVPPNRFATGSGLNTTARQVGGALGIAMVAAVLAANGLAGAEGFTEVWLLAGVAAAISGLVSSTLYRTAKATVPSTVDSR